jgi:hypothetical protein
MKYIVRKIKMRRPKQWILGYLIVAFVAMFLWGRPAESAEARLGLGFGYASNEGAVYQEMMVTSTSRQWYAGVTRIGGDDRHDYQYWRLSAGYRLNWRGGAKLSPYVRVGAAYFDEAPTDYISDKLAFDLAVGIRICDLFELELDQHNSTAGRSDNNEGLDAVSLSLIFPFGGE